ncbi:MAG TPA: hypothetical protein VLO11_05815 [Luteolibacter sp.]|nr:hypothetical protein [Luteolibacter sp.]
MPNTAIARATMSPSWLALAITDALRCAPHKRYQAGGTVKIRLCHNT